MMELPSVVYPPNRPLDRTLMPSKDPQAYPFMLFVDSSERGEFVSGCSNILGAYWESTLFHYKSGAAASAGDYSGYYISNSSSADAKFIDDNKVVLAEDNGCLKLLVVPENGDPLIICDEIVKTSARVEQLATWKNSTKVLACADTSVIVADMQTGGTNHVEEFKNYHTQAVTSVDTKKNEGNIFASASVDRKACIWDNRIKAVATIIYENEFCSLSSVSWNPARPDYVAVGSEGGVLYYVDIRQPTEVVSSYACFDAKIHRATFNNSGQLAVCGDVADVLVLNGTDSLKEVYRGRDHLAFVRGLTWFQDTLYSCGFDKQIIKHVV